MKGYRKYFGQKIFWFFVTLIVAVLLNFILPRLQRLAGNGEISVCTLSDSVLHPTADHFFE